MVPLDSQYTSGQIAHRGVFSRETITAPARLRKTGDDVAARGRRGGRYETVCGQVHRTRPMPISRSR